MKKLVKNHFALIYLLLMVALIWGSGCATPDPVKGWTCLFSSGESMADRIPPDEKLHQKYKAVIDDYQDYIKNAKLKHPDWWISTVEIYEDGIGQHAVKLTIETDLREYRHFYLMYDKSNVRTKVIKGAGGHQFHM